MLNENCMVYLNILAKATRDGSVHVSVIAVSQGHKIGEKFICKFPHIQ